MNYIINFESSIKKLSYNKDIIISSNIKLPNMQNLNKDIFNEYYRKQKLNIEKEVLDYYKFGIETYNQYKSLSIPFNNFEYKYIGNLTLNKEYFISIYFDVYIYTGGATSDIRIISNTWDMLENRIISLVDMFNSDYKYKTKLLTIIKEEISNNPKKYAYFDDLDYNLDYYFNDDNFYLTNDNLIIYYPKYTIASGSDDIITYNIPYKLLNFKEKYSEVFIIQ